MLVEIIFAMLALSTLVFAVGQRFRWLTAMLITSVVAGVSCVEAIGVLATGSQLIFNNGQNIIFGADYGIVDPLSAIFIIISSLAALSVVLYSRGYVSRYKSKKPEIQITLHYFCLVIVFLSVLLVVTLRDGFGFLFGWELMTISSFLLMLFYGERPKVRREAMNYLIIMHVGFVTLLAGFVTLHVNGFAASFDSLVPYFAANAPVPLVVVFLVGFGLKAGIFPLHTWMPEAESAAPPHVSAFMSGVMTKMGIYGVIRVVSSVSVGLWDVGMILFVVGAVTGVWGVVLAVMQGDVRRQLAYSTIENVGIIFLALGIGFMGKAEGNSMLAMLAVGGALLHVVSHCFMKTLLFLGAGNILAATGNMQTDSLGGLGKRMPITSALFLVGSLAICALPPLGGFVSEFMIYLGILEGVGKHNAMSIIAILAILITALISGFVVIAFAKLYGVVFLGRPRKSITVRAGEVGGDMVAAMAIPLAMILIVGLMPLYFIRLTFDVAGDMMGYANSSIAFRWLSTDIVKLWYALICFIGIAVFLWFVRRYVLRNRTVTQAPTWMCGFPVQSSKMQYTGESFVDGLSRISGRFVKNTGEHASLRRDEIFPQSHNFDVGHKDKMGELLAGRWVQLLRVINERFSRLRSGKINHYILYALLFILLIFVLSLMGVI